MTRNLNLSIDLAALAEQFQGLQGRHPGIWPAAPKTALLAALVAALLALAHLLYWSGLLEELDAGRQQEQLLRAGYAERLKKSINLAVLRRQKEQVGQYVDTLEKQLPSKAEMDALLSDINQAGVGRGLQFELFKPGQVVVRDYYAELPISVRVVGSYHDIGAFASDVANLPRIVTLANITLSAVDRAGSGQPGALPAGTLAMEAVAKTFRYLDPEEIAAQRREAAKKKQGQPGAAK